MGTKHALDLIKFATEGYLFGSEKEAGPGMFYMTSVFINDRSRSGILIQYNIEA